MDYDDRGESAAGDMGATEGYGSNVGAAERDGSDAEATDGGDRDVVPCKEAEVVNDDDDRLLAEKAYNELSRIFSQNYEKAIMEAGQYIKKEFYGDDIQRVRNNDPIRKGSLKQLIDMMENVSSSSPSRSWYYNARNLILQEDDLDPGQDADDEEKNRFHTYGQLLLSHKVILLSVSDITIKRSLIDEIDEKKLTIKQLRERLQDLNVTSSSVSGEKSLLQLIGRPEELFDRDGAGEHLQRELAKARPSSLEKIKTKALEQISKHADEITILKKRTQFMEDRMEKYNGLLSNVEEAISKKGRSSQAKIAESSS